MSGPQENLLSRKGLDNKYAQIEEVTRFEIQRQTQLFNRRKITEVTFKKTISGIRLKINQIQKGK